VHLGKQTSFGLGKIEIREEVRKGGRDLGMKG
jgi:hypothetical protein